MGDEKTTFSKSFETLLNKSIEANKILISEGTQMFKKFTSTEKQHKKNINIFQNELLTKTFNDYVKMNVSHFNNLIDLGLSFVKNINSNPDVKQDENDADSDPSFILEQTSEEGNVVSFKFLLDNIKNETVKCHFVYSEYILQSDSSIQKDFATEFYPQTFELSTGEAKPISISINIPDNTTPGLYKSKVQVKGFEPAYFAIQITVTKKTKKTVANERKRPSSKRK
jgi:hypothetical protein